MRDKCVILLSGGMDSSTLLYWLTTSRFDGGGGPYDCYPLTITYGQRHSKEIQAACTVCAYRGEEIAKRWQHVDLSRLGEVLYSALTGKGEIPEGHYADETMKQTVVPNRNMILLAIAGGYAQSIGATLVAYAPHRGDHAIYPDCRPEFVASVARTLKLSTGWEGDGVTLITPLADMDKSGIALLGHKLGVPFVFTWTCYKGGLYHCGVCGSCNERKEAFKLAGIEDPTRYETFEGSNVK